jgi:hypothetical protein
MLYILATPKTMKLPSAATAATLGATAGVMMCYQNGSARLMGFKENKQEVKRFWEWHTANGTEMTEVRNDKGRLQTTITIQSGKEPPF